jgi:hypothetical protein
MEMEHTSTPAMSEDTACDEAGQEAGKRGHRRAWLVSSTTLACAVGGALMGAFAFSAYPGSMPGAGGGADRLASGTVQSPGDSGALCTSWRNTATAAATAISCENYGVSSFADRLARAMQMRYSTAGIGASSLATVTRSRSHAVTGKVAGVLPATSTTPSAPSLPSLPSPGSTTKSTCISSSSSPSGSPSVPGSTTVTASGSGGKVTVKASSSGISVCGKAPTSPKLPTTSLPSVGSVTGVTQTTTKKHKKRDSDSLSGTLQGVTGTVGGL